MWKPGSEGSKLTPRPLFGSAAFFTTFLFKNHHKYLPRGAEFLPPPKRDAAFTFISPSVKGVIVAGKGTEQLADELAWHIGEMCGTTPEVVKRAAEGVPQLVELLKELA